MINVAVAVNVDLSQNTKDFFKEVLEMQNKARSESLEKSYEPLKQLVAMINQPCSTSQSAKPVGPIGPNGKPLSTEAQIEADALNEAAKAAEAAKQTQQSAPAPAPSKEDKDTAPAIGIEDVRKALAEKVNDHRASIKDKLTSLGAPSVTKLDPAKYQEMYDFLKSL